MTPPLAYRESCVPIAVAALTGLAAADVAAMLWRAGAACRVQGAPSGALGYGTEMHGAGELLVRHGWAVEWWGGNGQRLADARIYMGMTVLRAHRRAVEVHRTEVHRTERATSATPPARRRGEWSLAAWARRHKRGDWIVRVRTPMAHAVALRDGQLIAGGDAGADEWAVIDALRLHSPRGG